MSDEQDWADKRAAELMPCNAAPQDCRAMAPRWHDKRCPAKYRPAVAAALREARAEALAEAAGRLVLHYKTLMRDLPAQPRPERFDARALAISEAINMVRVLKEKQ